MGRSIFCLYFCFCFGAVALAQDAQGQSPMDAQQWQLTFDVIKTKVAALVEANNQLTGEYQSLLAQAQEAQKAIEEQSKKNEKIRQFLKERGDRSDQQVRIEELTGQVKNLGQQMADHQRQADSVKAQAMDWQRRIDLMNLKISNWELHQNTPVPDAVVPQAGDLELNALRKDLESQKEQEARLEAELAALVDRRNILGRDRDEIEDLKQKLEDLRRQKALLPQKSAGGSVDFGRYQQMTTQKMGLESKIHTFEIRINALKDHQLLGLTWDSQKKKLIHDIVLADAKNSQMRQKINNVHEDIDLLRGQIASLEKLANFSRGKGKIR